MATFNEKLKGQLGYLAGAKTEAEKAIPLVEALEKIRGMKLQDDETDVQYAYNRNWHIAVNALTQYNKP